MSLTSDKSVAPHPGKGLTLERWRTYRRWANSAYSGAWHLLACAPSTAYEGKALFEKAGPALEELGFSTAGNWPER